MNLILTCWRCSKESQEITSVHRIHPLWNMNMSQISCQSIVELFSLNQSGGPTSIDIPSTMTLAWPKKSIWTPFNNSSKTECTLSNLCCVSAVLGAGRDALSAPTVASAKRGLKLMAPSGVTSSRLQREPPAFMECFPKRQNRLYRKWNFTHESHSSGGKKEKS